MKATPPAPAVAPTHDAERWGELLCRDFVQPLPLARLADVVRHVQARDGLEQSAAARIVLEGLPIKRVFLLRVGQQGAELLSPRIGGSAKWFARDDMPARWVAWHKALESGDPLDYIKAERLREDMPEALQRLTALHARNAWNVRFWLYSVWVEGHDYRTDLDDGIGGRVAMLAQHAAENFGYGLPARALAQRLAPLTAAELQQAFPPDGGSWPHESGGAWSAAEVDAMFRMRWLGGADDGCIGQAVGASRQRVVQKLGPKLNWHGKDAWPREGWRPSAALLRECGLTKSGQLAAVS